MTIEFGPNLLAAIIALVSLGCSVVALLRARENAAAIVTHDMRLDATFGLAQKAVDLMHRHDGRDV